MRHAMLRRHRQPWPPSSPEPHSAGSNPEGQSQGNASRPQILVGQRMRETLEEGLLLEPEDAVANRAFDGARITILVLRDRVDVPADLEERMFPHSDFIDLGQVKAEFADVPVRQPQEHLDVPVAALLRRDESVVAFDDGDAAVTSQRSEAIVEIPKFVELNLGTGQVRQERGVVVISRDLVTRPLSVLL